jgi:hypothetical protein
MKLPLVCAALQWLKISAVLSVELLSTIIVSNAFKPAVCKYKLFKASLI